MITGFNTDIDHRGKVYHVQTEDKGTANPVVESLIYCSGEILTSRKSSYRDLTDSGDYNEDDLLKRMEKQHQGLIREIHNGKFDSDAALPLGHNIVTNRSLDEVVFEFLRSLGEPDPIRLELIDQQVLLEGTRPTLRLKVVGQNDSRPVRGAEVSVRIVSDADQPRDLFEGLADDDGFVEACFHIPELHGGDVALICEARGSGARASLKQAVAKSASLA